jgi:uncharacterized lipoprotein YmbA
VIRLSLPVAIALGVAALAGCASSPKSDFYTLSPDAPPASQPPPVPITVLIGTVSVPELVDRPQIVVNAGKNKVDIDEYARWADSLKSQIPRVMRADLAQQLNSSRVAANAMGGDAAAAYRVQIDVQRFEAARGDAVTVDVLWSVSPPGKGPRADGRSSIREPCAGPGVDAVVAAYSRALGAVSQDIAAAIRQRASP